MIFKSSRQAKVILDTHYVGQNWIIDYITVEPGSQCLMDSGNDIDPYPISADYPRLIDNYLAPFQFDINIYDNGDVTVSNPLDFN